MKKKLNKKLFIATGLLLAKDFYKISFNDMEEMIEIFHLIDELKVRKEYDKLVVEIPPLDFIEK